MTEMRDLYGHRLSIGTRVKLSGGYDDGLPTYLHLEIGTVVAFGRTRVKVQLDRPDYADRDLRVAARACVILEEQPLNGDRA